MDEYTEELPYVDLELLSVDTVEMADSGDMRAGISLIDEDGGQIHVTLSRIDAERLVLALAATVYDLRDDEEFCRGG
jgi:hypothetical protein